MKKKIILFLMGVAFFVICGCFSFQANLHEVANSDVQRKDEPMEVDLNKQIISQTFPVATKSMDGMKIKTATFDKIPSGTMTLRILQNNEVIYTQTIAGNKIPNNDFINIAFTEKVNVTSGDVTIELNMNEISENTPITYYVKQMEASTIHVREDKLNHQSLHMQYYEDGFSLKRFCYLVVSVSVLILYTAFVLKIIKRN